MLNKHLLLPATLQTEAPTSKAAHVFDMKYYSLPVLLIIAPVMISFSSNNNPLLFIQKYVYPLTKEDSR